MHEIVDHHKVCVVVPTYNNAQTLGHVLEGIQRHTSHIIVVNDGSTDSTNEVLQRFPKIDCIGYVRNMGKGWALRQGFQRALERGYDYAVTIDSDGQHFPDDIPQFTEAAKKHPHSIIIGARNMDQESVPGKSSFGNKFSNFWFKVETSLTVSDTQSGFRLYPLRLLSDINFVTRKFEFEVEVLVRAAWAGIGITTVPVRVYYPEDGKRVTHFRPFRDFTRISILNTVLVTVAFLYIKPRDLFREIKKKSSAGSFAIRYCTRMNPT